MLHSEINNLNTSQNNIKEDKISGICNTHRNAPKILVGKPTGKPRHGCEGNIKMDLKDTECEDIH
jgi:hypothetical protein